MDLIAAAEIDVPKGFDPDALIAREVLADELGDGFSPDDEERLAKAWEAAHACPLKRDWMTWPEWHRYKRAFKGVRSPADYVMDPTSAREALARLNEKPEWNDHDKSEITAICKMLHRDPPDFSKPRKTTAELQAESLRRFEKIESQDVWTDREKLVRSETDLGTLEFVQSRDAREEVRTAAMERIATLSVAAR